MKKNLLIGLLVFSLVALLVVGGTMAWFTDDKEVTNTFTAGTVKIELLENEGTDPVVETNVNPGDTYDKLVEVKSLGSKQTYVRVSIEPVWLELNEDEEWAESSLPTDNVELIFAEGEPGDKWTAETEGWYYYKTILGKDQTTEPLLSQVEIVGSETGNEYQGKTLRINVKAEAVQASHGAYEDAWGSLPTGVEEWTDNGEGGAV